MKLEQINWLWDDNERRHHKRVYDFVSEIDGTGIRLLVNRHNQYDLKAVHPEVPMCDAFEIEEEIDATISFHKQSYTVVEVTRDSFSVMFSERASPRTIEDVTTLINDCSYQWSEQRIETLMQRYAIVWNSHQQGYMIDTVVYDRDWS
ncbi:hypothetical protein MYOV011v1_p0340 [Vibrio phage 6E35.1a]|nr:hypothetical protein MYOV011v1_p0340 [Vibrio phage 6E35.1a]